MVPGPPFPSRISQLLMACGAIFVMRLSPSRIKALNKRAGGTVELCSYSKVKTPMINWFFERFGEEIEKELLDRRV